MLTLFIHIFQGKMAKIRKIPQRVSEMLFKVAVLHVAHEVSLPLLKDDYRVNPKAFRYSHTHIAYRHAKLVAQVHTIN